MQVVEKCRGTKMLAMTEKGVGFWRQKEVRGGCINKTG